MASKPLTIHITWVLPPAHVAEFYEALRILVDKVIEEKECLYFNAFEVQGKPGVIRLVEIWDCDLAWMGQVQSKKAYYQSFFETAKKITLEPQQVEIMNAVEGFRFMRPQNTEDQAGQPRELY